MAGVSGCITRYQYCRCLTVEVGVLISRLEPSLLTVFSQAFQVVVAASGLGHHAEEGAVESEVVALASEVIVTSQRCVCLELVVAVETRLRASEDWVERCS